MNLQHLNVKIMIADPKGLDFEAFIPIFHRWIQSQGLASPPPSAKPTEPPPQRAFGADLNRVDSERFIDVADYLHVPAGPGIILVGHEAILGIDHSENRWGLLYNRRTAMEGGNSEKIKKVIRAALTHARRLEEEPELKGKLKFKGEEWQMIVNDRLLAPNTEEGLKALQPDLKGVLAKLFGGASYACQRHTDPRERLTLDLKAERPFDVETLLKNLS